jgi:hypothetical protein
MALGAGAVALSTTPLAEHARWQEAARRDAERYGVARTFVDAGLRGHQAEAPRKRTAWDWLIVGAATAVFVGFAVVAEAPELGLDVRWTVGLGLAMLALLAAGGVTLWRATRFG